MEEVGMENEEMSTGDYGAIQSKLIALLTAANEDDLSLFLEMQDELWASEFEVDAVLTQALFMILGLIDEHTEDKPGGVGEYLQALALMVMES